jgi:hypothetical protein
MAKLSNLHWDLMRAIVAVYDERVIAARARGGAEEAEVAASTGVSHALARVRLGPLMKADGSKLKVTDAMFLKLASAGLVDIIKSSTSATTRGVGQRGKLPSHSERGTDTDLRLAPTAKGRAFASSPAPESTSTEAQRPSVGGRLQEYIHAARALLA